MSIKYKGQTISGPPGKDGKLLYVPITLTVSGWNNKTQTITVEGVSSDETAQLIQPVPALANQKAYYDAGIICAGQSSDILIFTAENVPTEDLSVYVVIQEVIDGPISRAVSPKDVNFYDYDGTLLYSYTLSEVKELSSLPDSKFHRGLIFQGWNWLLKDIKTLTRPMNIGAIYITDDGKTRLRICVFDKSRSNVPLYITQTISRGVTIDWGDGSNTETLDGTGYVNTSHQYTETGDYTIVLTVADGCRLGFGNNSCVFGRSGIRGVVYHNLLTEVNIGRNVTRIDNSAFYRCYSLASITIPDSVTSIGTSAIFECYSLASIAIPRSITSIGVETFRSCYSLATPSIPDSVTSIETGAFQYCYSLASITIPDSVTSISDSEFEYCRSLASITIPDSVTSIGENAFQECYCLASMTIPDSVTSIGAKAFRNCLGMAECHLKSTIPPTLANTNVFESISSDCIIYVPTGSLEAYKTAENWSTYASYMKEEPT